MRWAALALLIGLLTCEPPEPPPSSWLQPGSYQLKYWIGPPGEDLLVESVILHVVEANAVLAESWLNTANGPATVWWKTDDGGRSYWTLWFLNGLRYDFEIRDSAHGVYCRLTFPRLGRCTFVRWWDIPAKEMRSVSE